MGKLIKSFSLFLGLAFLLTACDVSSYTQPTSRDGTPLTTKNGAPVYIKR